MSALGGDESHLKRSSSVSAVSLQLLQQESEQLHQNTHPESHVLRLAELTEEEEGWICW